VFIGAIRDKRFRAFDAKAGKELLGHETRRCSAATPVTDQGKDGKEFVVMASGGPSDAGRGTEFDGNFPPEDGRVFFAVA
jgi:quinoprotein glucose dehydrogenase